MILILKHRHSSGLDASSSHFRVLPACVHRRWGGSCDYLAGVSRE